MSDKITSNTMTLLMIKIYHIHTYILNSMLFKMIKTEFLSKRLSFYMYVCIIYNVCIRLIENVNLFPNRHCH